MLVKTYESSPANDQVSLVYIYPGNLAKHSLPIGSRSQFENAKVASSIWLSVYCVLGVGGAEQCDMTEVRRCKDGAHMASLSWL